MADRYPFDNLANRYPFDNLADRYPFDNLAVRYPFGVNKLVSWIILLQVNSILSIFFQKLSISCTLLPRAC